MFTRLKAWFTEQVAEGVSAANLEYTKPWVRQAKKITKADVAERRACANLEDLANLSEAFPANVEVPTLIYDFCHLLTVTPIGSLGWLQLTVDDKIDKLVPGHLEYNDDFAMFLWKPDGGLVGLWLKDDRNPQTAPMVHMDSEGSFEKLAPNFLHFVDRLTKLDFDEGEYCDFLPEAQMEDTEDEAPIDMSEYYRDWFENHPAVDSAVLESAPETYVDYDDGKAQKWINQNITL